MYNDDSSSSTYNEIRDRRSELSNTDHFMGLFIAGIVVVGLMVVVFGGFIG